MEKEISSYEEFQEEIKEGTVLVDFYAIWCGPCQMLSPIIEEIANEHPEIKVLRVNTDKVQEAAAAYNIYSIPTLLYFKDGNLVDQSVGYRPKNSILAFLKIK